jgi:two-component system chemotaxis response regulator CheB
MVFLFLRGGLARAMSLRVLVVDDSPICRGVLRELLEAEGDIAVVGEAADGLSALALVESLRPDLITMDLDMPGVDGLETITRIMSHWPTPILVVTGEPVGPGSDLVFKAVAQGALDLLPKPSISNHVEGEDLRSRARALARVPVFLHMPAEEVETVPPPDEITETMPAFKVSSSARPAARMIAIAAGVGGPRAVAAVVGRLSADLPCAIALAQHLPGGFVAGYARFLQSVTSMRVEILPRAPIDPLPGTLYLPPDGAHIVCVADGRLSALDESPLRGYRPSATMLLQSLSLAYPDTGIGVILAGLGDDGAAGAAALHNVGALTIAEDDHARPKDMPEAAIAAGAIERVMPLQLIGDMLVASACIPQNQRTEPPPSD